MHDKSYYDESAISTLLVPYMLFCILDHTPPAIRPELWTPHSTPESRSFPPPLRPLGQRQQRKRGQYLYKKSIFLHTQNQCTQFHALITGRKSAPYGHVASRRLLRKQNWRNSAYANLFEVLRPPRSDQLVDCRSVQFALRSVRSMRHRRNAAKDAKPWALS